MIILPLQQVSQPLGKKLFHCRRENKIGTGQEVSLPMTQMIKAIVPDVPLGSHTASLGLLFYDKKAFPAKYQDGAFVAQHGSWNRSVLSGYKVIYVPFKNGKPSGPPEDFLTGFVANLEKDEVH